MKTVILAMLLSALTIGPAMSAGNCKDEPTQAKRIQCLEKKISDLTKSIEKKIGPLDNKPLTLSKVILKTQSTNECLYQDGGHRVALQKCDANPQEPMNWDVGRP